MWPGEALGEGPQPPGRFGVEEACYGLGLTVMLKMTAGSAELTLWALAGGITVLLLFQWARRWNSTRQRELLERGAWTQSSVSPAVRCPAALLRDLESVPRAGKAPACSGLLVHER